MTVSTVLYICIVIRVSVSWTASICPLLPKTSADYFLASNCHWKKIKQTNTKFVCSGPRLGNNQTNSAYESIAKDWREFELCGYLPIWESLPPSEHVLCWTQITSTGRSLGEETERIFAKKLVVFFGCFYLHPLENYPKFVVNRSFTPHLPPPNNPKSIPKCRLSMSGRLCLATANSPFSIYLGIWLTFPVDWFDCKGVGFTELGLLLEICYSRAVTGRLQVWSVDAAWFDPPNGNFSWDTFNESKWDMLQNLEDLFTSVTFSNGHSWLEKRDFSLIW